MDALRQIEGVVLMEWFESLIVGLVPSVISAVVIFVVTHKLSRAEIRRDALAEARKKESLLALEMQMATAKLAYAVAVAVKRGEPNGEVEDGIAAFEAAKKKYLAFLNEQATEHLK